MISFWSELERRSFRVRKLEWEKVVLEMQASGLPLTVPCELKNAITAFQIMTSDVFDDDFSQWGKFAQLLKVFEEADDRELMDELRQFLVQVREAARFASSINMANACLEYLERPRQMTLSDSNEPMEETL